MQHCYYKRSIHGNNTVSIVLNKKVKYLQLYGYLHILHIQVIKEIPKKYLINHF